MNAVMITTTNAKYPVGVTGKLEKFESGKVLVRYATAGGWSRCFSYPVTDITKVTL